MCFLNQINDFTSKCKAIESMFLELLYNSDSISDEEINKIRERFGLKSDGGPGEEENVADNVQVKQEIQELDDDDDDVKFKSRKIQ